MNITTTLHEKAERLVREGKVNRVGHGLQFIVQGDSNAYAVHLSYPPEASGRCDCPANRNDPAKVCSHLLAASIFVLAEEDQPGITNLADKRDPFRDFPSSSDRTGR